MANIINVTQATLSSKGQVVIPSILRKQMGLHEGSEIIIKLRDDGVCELEPKKRDITMLFGRGKSKKGKKPLSPKDMDDLIIKEVTKNDRY